MGCAQNDGSLMTTEDALASLEKSFSEKIHNKTEFRGETTCTIEADDLREITKFCRDELSFDYLIDITSIDNFGEEPRFEIVYHLYSMPDVVHLRLKLKVPEDADAVDTVSHLWPVAPSLLCPAPRPQKTANRALARRNCERAWLWIGAPGGRALPLGS